MLKKKFNWRIGIKGIATFKEMNNQPKFSIYKTYVNPKVEGLL